MTSKRGKSRAKRAKAKPSSTAAKARNPMAAVLSLPVFGKSIVPDKKKESSKRAARKRPSDE